MLPMSGVGEPMAGAPGDAGGLAPAAGRDGAAPVAPGRPGAPDWGAADLGAAGAVGAAADPGFARCLPALVWPVVPAAVVDGGDACCPAAARVNRQNSPSRAAAGRNGRRPPREPSILATPVIRAPRGIPARREPRANHVM